MLKAYPAIIHQETDATYWVEFPDIEGCLSNGDTIENTITNAQEALGGVLAYMLDNDIPLDVPSDIQTLSFDDGFTTYITCDPDKYRNKNRAVRKTVSIPQWLNEECEKRHLSLSAVLQNALLQQIDQP